MTTKLSALEISKLTAVITGGGFKRAASRDAAAKRFINVAAEAGIAAPGGFLDMDFDTATADLRAELSIMKGGKAKPTGQQQAASDPIEDAMRKFIGADVRDDNFMRDLFREVFEAGRAARRQRTKSSNGPTKREIAAGLLQRTEGCTARDILDATGWPAVSVPAIAKASGMKLRQEKDGRVNRYYGEPL